MLKWRIESFLAKEVGKKIVNNSGRWLFVEALAPSASCTGGIMSCNLNLFACDPVNVVTILLCNHIDLI